MRISDTSSGSKVNKTQKKKGTSSAGASGAFSIDMGTDVSGAEPEAKAGNIGGIQSLLSIDALGILANAGNDDFNKQQNVSWGKDVLRDLEMLKYQILNGKISYNSLLALQDRLNNIPVNPFDFKLKELIGEIETRAAVEIEKLKKLTNQNEV